MKTSDFYFDLPEELIAQTPLEKRDASRLLCLDKVTGEIQHRVFSELPELLREGDCLVMNDSRVLPARLLGARESGGAVEVLLLRDLGGGRWECLTRPGRKTKPGTKLVFGDGELEAEVIEVVPCKAEPTVRSTVFAGLPKGERSDFLVQKCTEMGVHAVVPVEMARSVARADRAQKKTERLARIAREAVIGAGTVITASTKIIDVSQPEPVTYKGYVPPRSVVIPGSYPKKFAAGEYGVPCALIIGQRKESTDTKTSLNDALRDFDVPV